jgi:hypothetical protein
MRLLLALAILGTILLTAQAPALPPATSQYVAGGTLVAKQGFFTVVDQGVLVCDSLTQTGVGGGCVSWASAPGADALDVTDVTGNPVAYQVCIDNDGDFLCGGSQDPNCPDQIFFSHADNDVFFNPLGPLPASFLPGCPGGFPGWVVFLCTGAHQEFDAATGAAEDPHAHAAFAGTLTPTVNGSGFGDFCGGGPGSADPIGNSRFVKAYVIAP